MDLQLTAKTAFVSGSTAGIGYAIARSLLREGATVIINGRSASGIENALNRLRQEVPEAKVSGLAADFLKKEEVEKLIAALPPVDILINNAGSFEPKPFEEIPDEDWFRFFEMNVMSGVRLSRHCFPPMILRNWGRIIFISSESGIMIPEEMIHYGMTKTAQLAISRGLAELTKGTGVTVNTVLPGPTSSEGSVNFRAELAKAEGKTMEEIERNFFSESRPTSLLQRFATVDEVANFVTYVASPLSSATNGAALRVDGGVVRGVF